MEPQRIGESSTVTVQTRNRRNVSEGSTSAGHGISSIRRLVVINLALVALQPLSAGLFLSGYERAVTLHAVVALALLLGALIQAVTAIILWRRLGIPGSLAALSIGLLVIMFVQVGLGYNKQYWLHVPIGVALFGGLVRQTFGLNNLERATGEQP